MLQYGYEIQNLSGFDFLNFTKGAYLNEISRKKVNQRDFPK